MFFLSSEKVFWAVLLCVLSRKLAVLEPRISLGEAVAVKMVSSAFRENVLLSKRRLREVTMLRRVGWGIPTCFRCWTFTKVKVPSVGSFSDTQLDTDLDQIRSDQPTAGATRQLHCGADSAGASLSACGCIHLDLKPAQVLMHEHCSIRIADLGMARLLGAGQDPAADMTKYVVSRWWRAHEVMLADLYSFELDVWSVGTILVELIRRNPLFAGRDYADQLVQIVEGIGSPSAAQVAAIPDEGARDVVHTLGRVEPLARDHYDSGDQLD